GRQVGTGAAAATLAGRAGVAAGAAVVGVALGADARTVTDHLAGGTDAAAADAARSGRTDMPAGPAVVRIAGQVFAHGATADRSIEAVPAHAAGAPPVDTAL